MESLRPASPVTWLAKVFSAKALGSGGVVWRKRTWVATGIGVPRFEQAVRDRGFHLIEAGARLMVICNCGPIRIRF